MELPEITFRLTPSDLQALERHHWLHGAGRWYVRALATALPLIFILMPLWIIWRAHAWQRLPQAWLPLALPLVPALGLVWLLRWARARDLRRTGIFDAEMAVRLQPDGLWHRDHTGEGLTFWSSVADVVQYKGRLFVLLAAKAGGGALVIPPAAFANPEQSAEFHAQLRALWQASRAPETGPQQGAPCG